jgi:phosphoribosylformylglycinamidine synthase
MGQLVGCIEGMAEACRALDFPIVSGNVSLYNETRGEDGASQAILPTPAIGAVGLIDDWRKAATIAFKRQEENIFLIGQWTPHLGQSLWLREIVGHETGRPPPVDLAAERAAGEAVRTLVEQGCLTAVHDISDGGLLVAVAEMALAGDIGAMVQPGVLPGTLAEQFFSEAQGCYLVTIPGPLKAAEALLDATGVPWKWVGITDTDVGGRNIEIGDGSERVALADLRRAHEGFFPALMGADAALA